MNLPTGWGYNPFYVPEGRKPMTARQRRVRQQVQYRSRSATLALRASPDLLRLSDAILVRDLRAVYGLSRSAAYRVVGEARAVA